MYLINKLNDEGNYVWIGKNEFNYGVSKSRKKLADIVIKNEMCDLLLRIDDDVILEPDFIEQLLEVINQDYDLASGVIPFIGQAQFQRESRFLEPVGNRVILNESGEIIYNGDDFGLLYYDKKILPIHHFRSSALYKKEIHEKVNVYENRLTKHGFREEQIFSFKCMLAGFKMGVNTKAIAWHLMTPSGGERFAESNEMIKTNETVFKEFTKDLFQKHGNFIKEYDKIMKINTNYTKESLLRPISTIVI